MQFFFILKSGYFLQILTLRTALTSYVPLISLRNMFIYDQTSLVFIQRAEEIVREILTSLSFEVKLKRFIFKRHLYPINVVVFEGNKELAHFNSSYYQIALNRSLIYQAKDAVLRDILKHELAHYLTFLEYGLVQAHGFEFKETCRKYAFPNEVALSTMNLEDANLCKVGDLESEKILEKVKKLLQLAQSSNSHESELATIKANALLLRHNLDRLNLKEDEAPIYLERVLLQKRKDAKIAAIYDMLRHFIVKPVISYGKDACCIEVSGTLTNVKLAVYVASFLDQEFEHLWNQAKKEHSLSGLRAKNSFFLGLAKGYDQKMKQSKESLSSVDQKALVLVEKDLTLRTKMIYKSLSSSRAGNNIDSKADSLGVKSGKSLSIRQGVESSSKNLYLGYSKS